MILTSFYLKQITRTLLLIYSQNYLHLLVLDAYVDRKLMRGRNLPVSDISRLHIPLLTRELLKKKIIKDEAHAIVDYHWRGDI